MTGFTFVKGTLSADGVPLPRIAEEQGTPTYVYSASLLRESFVALDEAFTGVPHLICYSVKANPNLALLHLFAGLGAGFDIVSGGELRRVTQATGPSTAKKVVFAGLGKTKDEMALAHKAGILLFNVESAEELLVLDEVGRAVGRPAPFALRVNPDVNARTHRYISTGLKTSKFGVPFEEAAALYAKGRTLRGVQALGVDCHIGSQLTDAAPMKAALTKVSSLYRGLKAKGLALQYLDIGGGLGIRYRDEAPPTAREYAAVVRQATAETGATVVIEPGRSLVGSAGLLLARVLYRKRTPAKTFVVVDAGMNDLLRPALYEAHHEVLPVRKGGGRAMEVDVVGPVCESADVLAHGRKLPLPKAGDLYALMSAGAYGMSMASNYNSRPRPCEVLADGRSYRVIRAREPVEALWRGETV